MKEEKECNANAGPSMFTAISILCWWPARFIRRVAPAPAGGFVTIVQANLSGFSSAAANAGTLGTAPSGGSNQPTSVRDGFKVVAARRWRYQRSTTRALAIMEFHAHVIPRRAVTGVCRVLRIRASISPFDDRFASLTEPFRPYVQLSRNPSRWGDAGSRVAGPLMRASSVAHAVKPVQTCDAWHPYPVDTPCSGSRDRQVTLRSESLISCTRQPLAAARSGTPKRNRHRSMTTAPRCRALAAITSA